MEEELPPLHAVRQSVVLQNPPLKDGDKPQCNRYGQNHREQHPPPNASPAPQLRQLVALQVDRDDPYSQPAEREYADRVCEDRQHTCQHSQGQQAAVPVANTQIEHVRVHGREQKHERPVAAELGVVDEQAAGGDEKRAKERSPRARHPPSHQIERGDGEHSADRRQQPEPELVERHERAYHIMIEEIQERPRVGDTKVDGIPLHENFVGAHAPLTDSVESKGGGEEGQACKDDGGGRPLPLPGGFEGHGLPRAWGRFRHGLTFISAKRTFMPRHSLKSGCLPEA